MTQWESGFIDYIQEVSLLLFEITAYREKTSDYICKLTVSSYLSYLHSAIRTTSDTQHHVELTNLSFTKPQAF